MASLILLSTAMYIVASGVAGQRSGTTGDVGIRPVTEETLKEAIALGESADGTLKAARLTDPLLAIMNSLFPLDPEGDQGTEAQVRTLQTIRDAYTIAFQSPYNLAALAAAEAKRRYERLPTLVAEDANKLGVVVHVGPGSDFTAHATIEGVLIKRGGVVIRPRKSELKPVQLQNRLGAIATSSEGWFTFDFEVFTPSEPITLVLIGAAKTDEFVVTPRALAKLR